MVTVGNILNQRYKIIKLIGSGGTAQVYLAHDLILDRQVAVKLLRYDITSDDRALKRFNREARAISELSHDNIVSLYDFDTDGTNQYLVMEYVDGVDLKQYIRDNYPLAVDTVVDIMQQITKAVSVAHHRGIIHRDLKTQNVLIRKDGQIKITDFGIATGLHDVSMTQTNTLIGSIHYLSPEQARGKSATNQSDIYALGIMMYEMLTGNVPFNGDTPVSIAMKHFQQEVPSVIKNTSQFVPQSVENVILKALAKSQTNRYQTVDDMTSDLSRALLISNHNVPKYVEPTTNTNTNTTSVVNNLKNPTVVPSVHQNHTKKQRKGLLIGVGSVVVALLLMLSWWIFFSSKPVEVPDVSGLSQTEATKKLTDLGLIVDNVIYQDDKNIAKDRVISTSPEAKTTVTQRTKITLNISSGYSGETVEDYRNKAYESAYADLIEKGFIVERKTEASTTVDSGNIISQSIPSGTKITNKNQVITLTVSSGSLTIADYSNKSFAAVKSELEKQGVTVIKQDKEDDTVTVGNIVSQSITANTKVIPENTTITFTVSVGKAVTLDNYVQQNAQVVKNRLEANGISVTLVEQESSSVSSGMVISQNKSAGMKVYSGDSVVLTVSKGSSKKMPNLLGSSQEFAKSQLNALGVNATFISAPSSSYVKGTVSKQSVLEGSAITPNMTITITISEGTSNNN